MTDEIPSSPSSQLSIIVDLTKSQFNFKHLCKCLSYEPLENCDHHHWHFGGIRSFTIPFYSHHDETTIRSFISQVKLLQNPPSFFPPFWVQHKDCQQEPIHSPGEVIKKNLKLGKFHTNNQFQIEYTAGALIQLDKYMYDVRTEIKEGWRLIFYHDRIDIDYVREDKHLRKTLKAEIMDRCVVIMREQGGFTLFINMIGNSIDYKDPNDDDEVKEYVEQDSPVEKTVSLIRTASPQPQPIYSTIRLVISLLPTDEQNREEQSRRLHYCYKKFIEFFNRNHINDCFGIINSIPSSRDFQETLSKFMKDEKMSFIKQYCWHMLLSLGFRFQQRLTEAFIQDMNSIKDDDEFYQTSLHVWRRSKEYYFIDLLAETKRYRKKIDDSVLIPSTMNNHQQELKKEGEQERWSLYNPPRHYAYVPSVTLTPTTICVKPFKLVKTNRVLREGKFGGNLMFALVDVKDENGITDLFPHDHRALRGKIETLLEEGFELGRKGRQYRYLHHSQSQLKDKQFWFYHYDGENNFSFEEAFAWMGDFQGEKIIAKHSARIAQCFTSAEATIQIPKSEVEYIHDIRTDDAKYNFTDGVGTMSTQIRDSINPNSHRQFSAIQIRYGGCKGVISVNPDLDNTDHQLRIRGSMNKFTCSHDILELCRISKPRPLYLNRQIIVLLSHRQIDDRKFLLLQNDHQQLLSESLVYPKRGYELLSEKLNRSLFPLNSLIHDAHLNLIQEPFFRQLLITTGKFELAQMRERTRLKIPRNLARNMIGIVDEYGVLEYGQVFVQYTELNGEYTNNSDLEKTVILEQKVVVTKNPCYHPGDIRVFQAVDAPRLRHLKDVIVFPQRGQRPHPNEISGSDLDGDEYAVIWHPLFIPETPNDLPFDYDSQISKLLRVSDQVTRKQIQTTVLDINEQSCVGKLCSIHLARMDLFGVADDRTVAIAALLSEELDAAKTGLHPLRPKDLMQLQAELGNERPDYFDKPYYKLYPSKHILGQLFRSCNRFQENWILVQTPPTTVSPLPVDPLLVHDLHHEYKASVEELARVYREAIMDILYVYRFSSDVDLICRFDSASPHYKTPLSKQQVESACLVADSAQMELKQLIRRIRRLFYEELRSADKSNSHRCYSNCRTCTERKMAKASALYIYCYTDTTHARRMLSLPWLFAPLLIEVRKSNIEKQKKLLSPAFVAQMLEIQPYRLIGQSLGQAVQYYLNEYLLKPDTKRTFYFQHTYSSEIPTMITLSLRPAQTAAAKRLVLTHQIPLIDYLLIEILQHYVNGSLSRVRSPITENPSLVDSVWQHILTRFILNKCSPLIISPSTTNSVNSSLLSTIKDCQFWSDEQACTTLQRFIDISIQCSDHDPKRTDYGHPTDYVHANEYLVSVLQKMATTNTLF